MNKDWNYAHMWDTMRRALEESAIEGLEVTPLNVLNGMIVLEELEERHRKEREERKEREKLESFPIWQLETIREDGKERWRIYRAINPDLPNPEIMPAAGSRKATVEDSGWCTTTKSHSSRIF